MQLLQGVLLLGFLLVTHILRVVMEDKALIMVVLEGLVYHQTMRMVMREMSQGAVVVVPVILIEMEIVFLVAQVAQDR